MAHYYFNNQSDDSEYNQNYFVPQDYEPSIYNLFDYNPTPYNNNNNNNIQQNSSIITTAYSTFTPTEPKSVQYCYYHEPNSYQIVTDRTFYSQTLPSENKISTVEFNSPDFDEYDPTPYGGGYDIVQTYGRPLPPSDQICYSRGGGSKASPPPPLLPPLPPPSLPPPVKRKVEEEEKRQEDESCEKEVISQIPSGYGLEAMDLFGSLFGYWPNYYYYAERENDNNNECRLGNGGVVIGCGGYQDSGAADYLFGTLDPYVERRDGGGSFGQPIHCYDRHFREEALSIVQVDDDDYHHQHGYQEEDNSWGIF